MSEEPSNVESAQPPGPPRWERVAGHGVAPVDEIRPLVGNPRPIVRGLAIILISASLTVALIWLAAFPIGVGLFLPVLISLWFLGTFVRFRHTQDGMAWRLWLMMIPAFRGQILFDQFRDAEVRLGAMWDDPLNDGFWILFSAAAKGRSGSVRIESIPDNWSLAGPAALIGGVVVGIVCPWRFAPWRIVPLARGLGREIVLWRGWSQSAARTNARILRDRFLCLQDAKNSQRVEWFW